MKEAVSKLKTEFNAKLLYWNNLKSNKAKALILLLFIAVIALKVFTTIFTFDWLASLFRI
ncbi:MULTISPECIES: hypothetical protein [Pseudoalteromonas]|uniref:Preprotein translocase subunit SecE n=1 Tax=Pseudoalteromonas fuliginea TaxID=1872678 RepID=A0A063KR05_9GAMM|nr:MULTISPECIES: hypothetical protein [Pseudoalteromonas]ALQ08255.1 hypothetical protein D172_009420 [Pseudoalteromonas sp. Bsw20308]ATG77505.1 hypothetical protein AOR04_08145 [Pseudoalteromonas sp. 1_2015MBL_MicDiv]KAA1158083.1 hypothetical protein EU508_15920 [Pseudoalteromonas fuliginea]KAA1162213.1 hypothetical protein EU509_04660 [Pseudoalteromonas fuliginea]KAA1168509.1 hypothetical protein EUZ79_05160 [Pseudoalteromonas fuliginea]